MTQPTPEQIAKLPKWAQEHIERITRLKESAEAQVSKMLDSITPSPFYTQDYEVKMVRRYLPGIRRVCCNHAGVEVCIYLPSEKDGQRLFGPEIVFTESGATIGRNVGIIARGNHCIQLVHKDNL